MTTAIARRGKRKTAATTEERRAQAIALRDRLAAYQDELDEAQIAAICALHDGYSERNALLIAMQNPAATDVSGFRAWLDRGRCVRKGEHGIKILAPAGQEAKVEATDTSPEKPGRQFFKLATVFDVAQTDAIEKEAS